MHEDGVPKEGRDKYLENQMYFGVIGHSSPKFSCTVFGLWIWGSLNADYNEVPSEGRVVRVSS